MDGYQPIVADAGSSTLTAGFAGEDIPSCYIPSYVGRPKYNRIMDGAVPGDAFVGNKAQEMRGLLKLDYAIHRGVVHNWPDLELILSHVYVDELHAASEEHPLLLTQAPLNPMSNKERLAELVFESFNVPALYYGIPAVLALYASGRTTGIVLDSGSGVTHAVPVYEGFSVTPAVQRIDLAGSDITEFLRLLLRKAGYSFSTTAERESIRHLKEKLCYIVPEPPSRAALHPSASEETYRLPDGNVIRISDERIKACEPLFKPDLIGSEEPGAHQVLLDALSRVDLDLRSHLYSAIVLTGGTTLTKGYAERLLNEVKRGLPGDTHIRLTAPRERRYTAWIGGSILAGLSTFKKMWITSAAMEEHGPSIVHRMGF